MSVDAKKEDLGIDSVRVDKLHDNSFEINFAKTGSCERFKQAM